MSVYAAIQDNENPLYIKICDCICEDRPVSEEKKILFIALLPFTSSKDAAVQICNQSSDISSSSKIYFFFFLSTSAFTLERLFPLVHDT